MLVTYMINVYYAFHYLNYFCHQFGYVLIDEKRYSEIEPNGMHSTLFNTLGYVAYLKVKVY